MPALTLVEKLRSGHVKRWNIVRVAREQTIAEHMYRVWLITTELCGVLEVSGAVKVTAAQWALVHDLPEVIIGDVPTPTKTAIKEKAPTLLGDLERSIDGDFFEWRTSAQLIEGGLPAAIVKIADLAEASTFLRIEGLGFRARQIETELGAEARSMIKAARETWPGPKWDEAELLIGHSYRWS